MAQDAAIAAFWKNFAIVVAGVVVVAVVIVLDSVFGARLGVLRPYATLGSGFVGLAIAARGVFRQLAATPADDSQHE